MSAVHRLQAYKEAQITTTDPGSVLLLLYQGAIDALNRAAAFMAAGNMAEKGKQILKANDIINQFIASLDFNAGGQLAQNLEALYGFMLQQILIANARNDTKALSTVISLLSTLKRGWEEAIVSQRKDPVKGAA
jgi:flagellar protein FliS